MTGRPPEACRVNSFEGEFTRRRWLSEGAGEAGISQAGGSTGTAHKQGAGISKIPAPFLLCKSCAKTAFYFSSSCMI
jgi:hypothetical protein